MNDRWIELAPDLSLEMRRPVTSLPEFREMLVECRTKRVERHMRRISGGRARSVRLKVETSSEDVQKKIAAWLVLALDAWEDQRGYLHTNSLKLPIRRFYASKPANRMLFTIDPGGLVREDYLHIFPQRIITRLPQLVPTIKL